MEPHNRKGRWRINLECKTQENLEVKNKLTYKNSPKIKKITKILKRDKYLYLLLLPAVVYYILFAYIPMYGSIIAFKDFNPMKGIIGSDWVGFKWFLQFFNSIYFGRLIKNTLILSINSLIWGFPLPIIFALMLNEVKDGFFKRITQTVSYLPHFISIVVVVGILNNMLDSSGMLTSFIHTLTGKEINFLNDESWFRTLYVGSGVWQEFGWSSIIYLAALSGVDPSLYEAAKLDGASRIKQVFYITIPSIMPTIIILLILNVGSILSVGFTKIILMYSPATYSVADVISTYVYRAGLLKAQYSFGAAVDLFNSVANFIILIVVNKISRKVSETSLW
jgi:putative aldouronate transport system permease protein